MRRMYQTEWHGIRFSEFSTPSSTRLPNADFYDAFYEAFFERYKSWDEMSAAWLESKGRCVDQLLSRTLPGSRVLAVGCGLGYIEHRMLVKRPELRLTIQEVAASAWRWIGSELPDNRRCIGAFPDCIQKEERFDLVYLSAVDYSFSNRELVDLLAGIRPFLATGGRGGECVMISASLQAESDSAMERLKDVVRSGADVVRAIADRLQMHSRGQWWGWSRTRREYRALMRRAGYRDIEEGFLDAAGSSQFWISGR